MKTLRELLRDGRFSLGAAVLLVLTVLALLSLFSPYDPTEWRVVPRDMPPSWEHLLGTDSNGQDVFWQMTFAVRNSLAVAVFASVISRVIAVTVGLVAGYSGGVVDRVLMFISDGFMVSLREREFTYTAILSGTPTRKLIFNEYFPFIIPLVLATLINHMAFVVGMEMTLALIGLTNLSIPTLGAMLQWAVIRQAMLLGIWWWLFAPIGVAVSLFVALYLVSVSISVYLDPRARIQRVGAR